MGHQGLFLLLLCSGKDGDVHAIACYDWFESRLLIFSHIVILGFVEEFGGGGLSVQSQF